MNRIAFVTKSDSTLGDAAPFVVKKVQGTSRSIWKWWISPLPVRKQGFDLYKDDTPVVHLNVTEISRQRVVEKEIHRLLPEK